MFYSQTAKVLTTEKISDGMGGWLDYGTPTELATLKVVKAPVSAELLLKEYGLVKTTSMKLFTEDDIPEGDIYISFENNDYRILQNLDYGSEKGLLLERV